MYYIYLYIDFMCFLVSLVLFALLSWCFLVVASFESAVCVLGGRWEAPSFWGENEEACYACLHIITDRFYKSAWIL